MGTTRVCIVPEYPLSFMSGGTLVQAIETRKALAKYVPGMEFELFNWSETRIAADLYHFIGLPKYLVGICSLVAQMPRPYVLPLLMGSHDATGWSVRVAGWRRRISSCLGRSREHQRAIEQASTIIALTPNDADAIAGVFSIPRSHIQIVPVAVSDFYFEAKPDLWRDQYGSEPFVLCVGTIQKRKNQLLLVKLCNQLQLPLVIVGSPLPGQDAYAEQVRVAMLENQKLGGRWLHCDDALLASAYAACKVFVLLSSGETQPASVLQAMALQKPVLLGNASYASAKPFEHLPRVDLGRESDVKQALQQTWNEAPPTSLTNEFTWREVCRRLAS